MFADYFPPAARPTALGFYATVASFCGYGISTFQSLFINRSFGLTAGEAAILINVPVAIASATGTFATDCLAQKVGARSPTAIAWLLAAGMTLSVPFYVLAFSSHNLWICAIGLCIGGSVKYA